MRLGTHKRLKVDINNDLFECMFVNITLNDNHKKLILGNIYRPTRTKVNEIQAFTNGISCILKDLEDASNEIVLI